MATFTLPGADIRSYYAELGIPLPESAHTEASVRCFANPNAHRRSDRKPSCSVNLEHGTWHCHGCQAKGGAFDAATDKGHTDRSAIDLMVRYGITTHKSKRERRRPPRPPRATPRRTGNQPGPRTLTISETDVRRWQSELHSHTALIARLARDRGWRSETMRELELGIDRGRITIPVRDHDRRLVGLLRYQPFDTRGRNKMRAAVGSRRQLLPHPAAEPAERVLLVEGEPDMIAARSHGLPAISLPGVSCWQPNWAQLLSGRHVATIMDSDRAGRTLSARIAHQLKGSSVTIVDLAPDRDDGYDLTDWLLDHPGRALEAVT